ncbi:hypothetical protein B6N60_03845 [Richelia sinica FACHB-800]|uniref:Uncharacterized protein n=1 Tax=Richelia sinica FACHB-800 TaxID=1357546 RepID=A0A975TAI7_9NOST|nr:hypothetical protein [Richelia sinica]MBD2664518.1 hypothetical protein [Richelia sinica FACHB-800]QXE25135.1 hypothetical protein B6N60_03845 [Richelia sinica FACHB-800]
MNHFNFKSLGFYGGAITIVLILFKTVTAYGENNLVASPMLNTRYSFNFTNTIPDCQLPQNLTLYIQQSGIYVNASLIPVKTNADTESPLHLTGKLNNQQLNLSGKIDKSILCQNIPKSQKHNALISLGMALIKKDNITGQIKIKNLSSAVEFKAIPITDKITTKSNSH